MSTAVATKPEVRPIQHTVTWGKNTWKCINPYCDGYHHVFCSCEH